MAQSKLLGRTNFVPNNVLGFDYPIYHLVYPIHQLVTFHLQSCIKFFHYHGSFHAFILIPSKFDYLVFSYLINKMGIYLGINHQGLFLILKIAQHWFGPNE